MSSEDHISSCRICRLHAYCKFSARCLLLSPVQIKTSLAQSFSRNQPLENTNKQTAVLALQAFAVTIKLSGKV